MATTTGTTSVQHLRKHERGARINFNEVYGKDHADSFLLLETGRADAFVMDGSILAANISKSKNPADFKIVGDVLNVEPIGSLRTPHVNMFDARVSKRLGLAGGRSLELRMDVFNLMNIDTLRNWNVRSGPIFLRPTAGGSNNATSIVPPRLVMFGASYNF